VLKTGKRDSLFHILQDYLYFWEAQNKGYGMCYCAEPSFSNFNGNWGASSPSPYLLYTQSCFQISLMRSGRSCCHTWDWNILRQAFVSSTHCKSVEFTHWGAHCVYDALYLSYQTWCYK